MALTKTIFPAVLGANLTVITGANATAVAVKTSSGTIYGIEIDNTANSADSFVKLYNLAAGSTTVGSDDPDMVLKAPATKKMTYLFNQGVAQGTAITLACVTLAGTAGNSTPISNVTVKVVYD